MSLVTFSRCHGNRLGSCSAPNPPNHQSPFKFPTVCRFINRPSWFVRVWDRVGAARQTGVLKWSPAGAAAVGRNEGAERVSTRSRSLKTRHSVKLWTQFGVTCAPLRTAPDRTGPSVMTGGLICFRSSAETGSRVR